MNANMLVSLLKGFGLKITDADIANLETFARELPDVARRAVAQLNEAHSAIMEVRRDVRAMRANATTSGKFEDEYMRQLHDELPGVRWEDFQRAALPGIDLNALTETPNNDNANGSDGNTTVQ